MAEHHELMGGKLHVYRRENSSNWQCSAYIAGKNWRVSTKDDSLSHAKDFAEDWYLGLRGKARNGELKVGKTFSHAAEQFIKEFNVITFGERSPKYVQLQEDRIHGHLMSFFGNKVVTEITPGLVQEYRLHRMTKPKKIEEREKREAEEAKEKRANGEEVKVRKPWTPPARSTLHQEIIALRHVLRTAERHGWLPFLPDISAPYKASGKISHRAWFSPKEYQTLYEATGKRAANPPHKKWRWQCEQLHDFVLFMVNTGLRPDEARNLQFRDVEIVDGPTSNKKILEISVRGKRGTGYCKSMNGAVEPFRRLQRRMRPALVLAAEAELTGAAPEIQIPPSGRLPQPTDRLFPNDHRELLNKILGELSLKTDREGQVRTAYSLRHTYICLRLMEGADIYQIAKNCRTSVEMIEKFYASHIKDMIDAAAVNVMKKKPKKDTTEKRTNVRGPQRTANAKGARKGRSGGHPKSRQ
ncbi:MAG: site-specific integrase [Rhizomicrobium sp.]